MHKFSLIKLAVLAKFTFTKLTHSYEFTATGVEYLITTSTARVNVKGLVKRQNLVSDEKETEV